MAEDLELWARSERQFIWSELEWFKAGGKLISPSGDDITASKVEELNVRLEHVRLALDDNGDDSDNDRG